MQYSASQGYPPRAAYDGGSSLTGSRRRRPVRPIYRPFIRLGTSISKVVRRDRRRTPRKAKEHDSIPRRESAVRSGLYQASFALVIVITAVVLVASAWGLGEQAWRSGGQRRWNIVFVVGAYVAIAIISLVHFFSRVRTNRRQIRSMPKPYMPTKVLDLDQKVADHISTEYSRTAVIAHIGQATTGQQEGWGVPGTKWADKHFRTAIIATLGDMRHYTRPLSADRKALPSAPSLTISRLRSISQRCNDPTTGITSSPVDSAFIQTDPLFAILINTYISYIDRALYARREPNEEDAEAVEQLVEVIRKTCEIKRRKIVAAEAEDRYRQKEKARETMEPETKSDKTRRRNTDSAASLLRRRSSMFGMDRAGQSSPSSMGTVHRHASTPLQSGGNRPRSRTVSYASTSARSGLPPSMGPASADTGQDSIVVPLRSRANSVAVGARSAAGSRGSNETLRRRTMSSSTGILRMPDGSRG